MEPCLPFVIVQFPQTPSNQNVGSTGATIDLQIRLFIVGAILPEWEVTVPETGKNTRNKMMDRLDLCSFGMHFTRNYPRCRSTDPWRTRSPSRSYIARHFSSLGRCPRGHTRGLSLRVHSRIHCMPALQCMPTTIRSGNVTFGVRWGRTTGRLSSISCIHDKWVILQEPQNCRFLNS